jgi:hypothetical protein
LVASLWKVFSIFFEAVQESEYEIRAEVLYGERFRLDVVVVCRKGKEELEGIAVGLDGKGADPFDSGKVVSEKLLDERGKLHVFIFCHRAKSSRC